MKALVKTYWKLLLIFAVVGLLGGFFVGLYALDSYPEEFRQEVQEQGLTDTLVGLVTAVQSAIYGVVLGALGIALAKKVGLWRDCFTLDGQLLFIALGWSIIGGRCLILPDLWFLGNYEPAIRESYLVKPTIPYLIAMVTYGGVIEEVMLRLFMMSFIAFILHKIFGKKHALPSPTILIISNVAAALLFAAGHLPVTFLTIGSTPMIIFRCFLLNGCFGLAFGWLYRKFGLRYAMIAHGGCHVVSKLIWILFI